jgi:hypothetical protein
VLKFPDTSPWLVVSPSQFVIAVKVVLPAEKLLNNLDPEPIKKVFEKKCGFFYYI